jgi:hypothetical protein
VAKNSFKLIVPVLPISEEGRDNEQGRLRGRSRRERQRDRETERERENEEMRRLFVRSHTKDIEDMSIRELGKAALHED